MTGDTLPKNGIISSMTEEKMSIFTECPDGIVLNVRAQPRSSRPGLDGLMGDALKVRIKSAPVDGKANKELVATVADEFGLPKSRVSFKSGETSKTKRLLLMGVSAAEFKTLITEKKIV